MPGGVALLRWQRRDESRRGGIVKREKRQTFSTVEAGDGTRREAADPSVAVVEQDRPSEIARHDAILAGARPEPVARPIGRRCPSLQSTHPSAPRRFSSAERSGGVPERGANRASDWHRARGWRPRREPRPHPGQIPFVSQRDNGASRAHPAGGRRRLPQAPAEPRKGDGWKALLAPVVPADPRPDRRDQDWPVTPEVAGSSPVAPVKVLQIVYVFDISTAGFFFIPRRSRTRIGLRSPQGAGPSRLSPEKDDRPRQPEVLWSLNAEAARLQARLAIGHDECDGSRAHPDSRRLSLRSAREVPKGEYGSAGSPA
jgi:hypothetical protein